MVSSYIAWYLFLAGAGGGAFLLGSFVDFALRVSNRSWLRGASAVTDAGLLAGPVLVALGTVFLALDCSLPRPAVCFQRGRGHLRCSARRRSRRF